MAHQNTDEGRRRSAATSKASRRSAEARRCPKCDRKSAIVRRDWRRDGYAYPGDWTAHCRWEDCDYVRLRPAD